MNLNIKLNLFEAEHFYPIRDLLKRRGKRVEDPIRNVIIATTLDTYLMANRIFILN
jgi:hypothetical protein